MFRETGVERAFTALPKSIASLKTKDYTSAKTALTRVVRDESNLINWGSIRSRVPLISMLAHFYLGQVYEGEGKKEQARDEYQDFLGHFSGSKSSIPQIAAAREAVKRLM